MHRYLLYFFLLMSFISCNKDKFKAPGAAYLIVNPLTLKTSTNQGSNSQKITDIWYYVNGQFKGAFPVGSVMPVIASNDTEITLFAGIKNNGISATRLPYPFYNSITINKNIESGKTYTVAAEFQYNTGAFFYYTDDFDTAGPGTGSWFSRAGDSLYVLTSDPSKTYGGTGNSVYMSMSDAKPTSRMIQTTGYYLPSDGSTIYLELNYKCNQPFTVGVIGGGFDERTAITVNTSEEWNKIYVQLSSAVSTPPVYSTYKVFIHAKKEVASPEIYIDNVKLIYQ